MVTDQVGVKQHYYNVCYFIFIGDTLHPKYASLFQIFKHDELADIVLDTIVFYVKGRIEGVPLYGISGELGSVLNLKYIVKHRVQSGMLDKVCYMTIKSEF